MSDGATTPTLSLPRRKIWCPLVRGILASMAIAGLVAFAFSISRGDTTTASPANTVMPAPGDETQRTNPFVLHDPGPEIGHWNYEHLTAEEKAVVDRGRTRPNAAAMHGAYNTAVQHANARATATAAANEMQAGEIEAIGVVP